MIQAYEKIHMEKSNLQRDLDKMVRDAFQLAALSLSLCCSFTLEPYGLCMRPDGGQCSNMADTECICVSVCVTENPPHTHTLFTSL